jgi:hypothetical protein
VKVVVEGSHDHPLIHHCPDSTTIALSAALSALAGSRAGVEKAYVLLSPNARDHVFPCIPIWP